MLGRYKITKYCLRRKTVLRKESLRKPEINSHPRR
jgi:hypothetical protein